MAFAHGARKWKIRIMLMLLSLLLGKMFGSKRIGLVKLLQLYLESRCAGRYRGYCLAANPAFAGPVISGL